MENISRAYELLQNGTFWQRLVEEKIHDELELQKLQRDATTDWKKVGLELKLVEIIDGLEQNEFDNPEVIQQLNDMMEKLQPFVENVKIKKLKPRRRLEESSNVQVVNVPSDECPHGSLEFLGRLSEMKSLSISFNPGEVGQSYERRFFQVASNDITNIGKALMRLKMLESFALRRSDLSEPMKIRHLLEPMMLMENLKFLDLSFCSITSEDSGECFEKFLSFVRSLQHLELKGNNLNFDFCDHLARGIQQFEGNFEYLGLSMTPIVGNGMSQILKSLREKNNVQRLDISNCGHSKRELVEESFEALISLMESKTTISEIKMENNTISSQGIKQNFIKALDKNYEIDNISCVTCGEFTHRTIKLKYSSIHFHRFHIRRAAANQNSSSP